MTQLAASLPAPLGVAVIIGAGGGLGSALLTQLAASGVWARVLGFSRNSIVPVDYSDESTLAHAALAVAQACQQASAELRLLIVATGFLHGDAGQPERSFANIDAAYLQQVFAVNTLGPALVMKHFLPLMPKQARCVAGFLSARVGSIGDNALGGWYGYRASKSALNQLVKTASIELTRRNKQSICVALHPGTVATALSQPFAKTGLNVRPAQDAAGDLLRVLHGLQPADTGHLVDYQGQTLAF